MSAELTQETVLAAQERLRGILKGEHTDGAEFTMDQENAILNEKARASITGPALGVSGDGYVEMGVGMTSTEHPANPPRRRTRSDAGRPRQKPPQAPAATATAGGLTEAQVIRLRMLVDHVGIAEKDLSRAQASCSRLEDARDNCHNALEAFISSLAGGK